ncbi:zinc finger BED domain-containing protein RICESLEEPER 2-like protein [Tanacetum coccineum]
MIRVASTQNNPSNIQEDNQVRNNVEEVLEPPAKKNKRLRSLVWNHFEKITIDGKQKAECHACKSLLSGESNHDQVIKGIETNKSRVANTADMWTSSNQKKGFIAITGHYIDNDWILRSKILRFLYVPCPHTSEVLTNVLMEALMEWNVDTKLSTITLDNCSTNDKLIDIAPIENVRESISYWTATPKRVEKFEETCRQLKITYSKTLGLDCQTRWNATYLMLKTALMYKDVFTRLKQRDSHYKTLLVVHIDMRKNGGVICKKLEVFHNVTAIFSRTRYLTTNLYFPKVCDIRLKLNEWLVSPTQLVSNMASKMIENFDEYWGEIPELTRLLHPCFRPSQESKMEMIEFYFPQIYPDDSVSRIKKVRKICEALILEYQEKTLDREYDVPLIGIVMGILHPTRYFREGLEPRSPDFDILLWWKLRGAKYHVMQAIARDILAIPVSSVASESAFSTSGRLISPH